MVNGIAGISGHFLCPASETPIPRFINNFSLAVATSCRTVLAWWLFALQLHGHLLCNHGAASRLSCMGLCNPRDAREKLSPLGVGGGGLIIPFVIPWLDNSNTPSTWLLRMSLRGWRATAHSRHMTNSASSDWFSLSFVPLTSHSPFLLPCGLTASNQLELTSRACLWLRSLE